MIYVVSDKDEGNLQTQIDFKDDKVTIINQDLADDSNYGVCVNADKADFMKLVNAIKFIESDYKATGDISALADTIKSMLAEFEFTTPILDGNDSVAYDAFAMRMIELLEAFKTGIIGGNQDV